MKFKISIIYSIIILFFAFEGIINIKAQDMKTSPVTVDSVDLNKYVGLWYEIAKIPNRFQKNCKCNTTATYNLREDGKIDVINRCIEEDGDTNEAKGLAKVVDATTNAKLEVSFVRILGIQLFWGDYWIIGLDKDYKYAVVGTPSRRYGWILGRSPKISSEYIDEIFNILRKQGYDPKDFVMTEQNEKSNK